MRDDGVRAHITRRQLVVPAGIAVGAQVTAACGYGPAGSLKTAKERATSQGEQIETSGVPGKEATMEKRRLGRTGHMSTVVTFGAFAVGMLPQEAADETLRLVLQYGVNHIDVAPSYGEAELRLGPWLERERNRFFLGCKTQKRTRQEAWDELQNSLKRLRVQQLDL